MNYIDWAVLIVIGIGLACFTIPRFISWVSEACTTGIINAFKKEKEKEEQHNGEKKDESIQG